MGTSVCKNYNSECKINIKLGKIYFVIEIDTSKYIQENQEIKKFIFIKSNILAKLLNALPQMTLSLKHFFSKAIFLISPNISNFDWL